MFHSVELRAFCHATEDEGRVEQAIHTLWPGGEVRTERLEGHHGNPLLMMACRIDRRQDVDAFWRHLKETGTIPAILQALEERVDDEAVLHFRVDKQRAFGGTIELAQHDDVIVVRAKVVAHPARKTTAVRAARDYLSRL
jgi:RNA binding exosome subunit